MTILSPRRRAEAWRAAPFAILVLAILAFDVRYHEPWRDEVNVALIARGHTWAGLVRAMRLEGVPPLFHALLKLLGTLLPDPAALAVAGVLGRSVLLYGTYRLLAGISRNPRASVWATLALGVTYAYAYELGVMVRQYTLGLGLSLLSFASLRAALGAPGARQRRSLLTGTAAAALAALTSAHAACVAGAGLLAFGSLSVVRRRPLRAWWPILLTLPAFLLALYLASPFPARVGMGNQVFRHTPWATEQLGLQGIVDGLFPADWWLVESPSPLVSGLWLTQALAILRGIGFWGLVAGGVAALAARAPAIRARPGVEAFDLIAGLAGIPPLLDILVHHYWGFYRHHLHVTLPLLVIVVGWGLDRRPLGPLASEARRAALYATAPWFAFQALLGAANFAFDVPCSFSETKSASSVLPPGAHVLGGADWQTIGLLFWRPDVELRSPAYQGHPARYILPEVERDRTVPWTTLVADECRSPAKEGVYVASHRSGLGPFVPCATDVPFPRRDCGERPFLVWEGFEVLKIDCACVSARAR